jgi:hypothetical protein
MQTCDYLFNVSGDFSAKIQGMTEATGAFSAKVESAKTGMKKIVGYALHDCRITPIGQKAFEEYVENLKSYLKK